MTKSILRTVGLAMALACLGQTALAASFACHVILENNAPYIQLVESTDKIRAMALAARVKARVAPHRNVAIKQVIECIAGPHEKFSDPKVDAQFRKMPL